MGIMTNGVQQWVLQRTCNAIFIIFGIVLLKTILADGLSYEALSTLFDSFTVKIYVLITLVLACVNSVLAGWQITGDYAEKFSIPPCLMMGVTIVVSLVYLAYGCILLFV